MEYYLLAILPIILVILVPSHAYAANIQVTITSGASDTSKACASANDCFSPDVVNIGVGDTVTWTNDDTVGHTATSGNPTDNQTGTVWDSSLIKAGGTFTSPAFNTAGTYNYFCMVHPWMTGEIIVGGGGTASQPPIQNPPPTNFPPPTTANIKITQGSGSSNTCASENNCFNPNFYQATQGTTITWGNDDSVGHTVTSGRPSDTQTGTYFDSSLIRSGQTWSFTFENPGTYYYFCQIHPWMSGSLVIMPTNQPVTQPIQTQPTPPPPVPQGNEVTITKGASDTSKQCVLARDCFSPSVILINVGQSVTWYNQDTVGHTATSGNPSDNQTGTIFDSSLIKAGGTYTSPEFLNPGTYNYFCMVHPWMMGQIIVGGGNSVPPTYNPPSPTPYTVNVQTDKSSYNPGDSVTITVYSSNVPSGQNVAILVTDPSSNIVASRTIQFNSQGSAQLQVGLSPSAQAGAYQVTASASSDGNYLKGTTTFTTNPIVYTPPQSSGVTISSIQPTNQMGSSTVTSYGRGTTGFVKVVVSSTSSQSALITVNLVGSDGTSLGVGSIKSTLGTGTSEMVVSFYIPTVASAGNANIYADVYSDWPTNGGTPLTAESSSTVGIQ